MLKEKDQQIEELTAQANQYVNEMEASAALVEDLRAELNRGRIGCCHAYSAQITVVFENCEMSDVVFLSSEVFVSDMLKYCAYIL